MSALPQSSQHVIRDRAWVEREYNQEKYPLILEAVREVLTGSTKSLARGVGHVIERERGAIALNAQREFLIDGAILRLPTALGSAGVSGFTTNAIAASCSSDTSAIVELGAGWGRNLFLTYFSGVAKEETEYYALEYAETARDATHLLSRLDQQLDISALPFDYHEPSFGRIPESDAPTVLTTVHSVEQIPQIRADVITDFLKRRPNTTGVHVEPIGWQLPNEIRDGRPSISSESYAEHHDYNRNFWSVLKDLEARGHLEITDVLPDIVGQNVTNPATLIRWKSCP